MVREDNARIGRALALWLLLPVMSAWFVIDGVLQLGPAWRAHEGLGTPGVFTARCSHGDCLGGGTWTSGDGRIRLHPVRLYDEPDQRLHTGRRVPAQYAGGSGAVYGIPSNNYRSRIANILVGLIGLAAVGAIAVHRKRRERADRLSQPDPNRFRA